MTNSNILLATGTTVQTWDGHIGTVLYCKDGWYGVRLNGEHRTDEWQGEQLEVVP